MQQKLKQLAMYHSRRLYVATMMQVVGRALQALTENDDETRQEILPLPTGFVFSMQVMPNGPGLAVEKTAQNTLRFLSDYKEVTPDLAIYIKHIEHAFRMLSFQESTARAFANDRMIVDGDISKATRMVRVLNRLEAFILPKMIASLAVKEVPDIPLVEKVSTAARVYSRVATNFVQEQVKLA